MAKRPGSQRNSRGAGRGGQRQGTPGIAYQNRTDLNQPVRVAPSQTYGQGVAQQAAQRALPLPSQPPAPAAPPVGGSASPSAQQAGPPPVLPGGLGALAAPTARPGEPITAGMPSGPGPGPEILGSAAGPPEDPTVATLKGILSRYPNPDLQALIVEAQSR